MRPLETVGIKDGLTVTVRESKCVRDVMCPVHLVKLGVHGVRILKADDTVFVLEDGMEREVQVDVAIDWDGLGLVKEAGTAHRLDLNKLKKVCPDCRGTIHSWRSADGEVPEDGVSEG